MYDLPNWVKWCIIIWAVASVIFGVLAIAEKCHGAERNEWFKEVTGQYVMGMEKGHTNGKINFAIGKYLNDSLNLRAEGTIGSIMVEHNNRDTRGGSYGASFVLCFDPRIYENYRFFVEAGVGVSYVTDVNYPSLLKPGVAGLVDGGIGITMPVHKKIEYILGFKYSHISSLKPGDRGLNMIGVMTGVRW